MPEIEGNKQSKRNISSNNGHELSKTNDRYQTTHCGSSEYTKQNKWQKKKYTQKVKPKRKKEKFWEKKKGGGKQV